MSCDRCGSNNIMMADCANGDAVHKCLDCGHSVRLRSWLNYTDEEWNAVVESMVARLSEEADGASKGA